MLTVSHGHTNFIFESFNTSMLYFKSSPRKLSRNNSSIQTEALSIFAAIGTIEYGTRYHRCVNRYVYAVSNACLNKGVSSAGGRRRCVPRHENFTRKSNARR